MSEGETAIPEPRQLWLMPYQGIRFVRSLKWLLAGALLYALLLLVAMAGGPGDATLPILGPSLYLTPMFGLPYVLGTVTSPGRVRRMFYFILMLPLAHVAANYVTVSYAAENFDLLDPGIDMRADLIAGAVGGLTGATFSFTLLGLLRLTPPGRRELSMMIFGAVLLAAVGAATMAAGLHWTDALRQQKDPGRAILWYEIVHVPWQVTFALLLAWLMRTFGTLPKRADEPAIERETPVAASDSQAVAARLRDSISAE